MQRSQVPVVRSLDNAIHRINRYPPDSVVCFVNIYPPDRHRLAAEIKWINGKTVVSRLCEFHDLASNTIQGLETN